MNLVSAVLVIAAISNSSQPTDYKTAYERAQLDDRPLLVLVTAEWCPPCQIMKTTTIPKLISDNRFRNVHFASIDLDKDPKNARNLIGNRGVPQLILYQKIDAQWNVRFLSGLQTVSAVETFIGNPDLRTANADSLAIDQ